MKKFHLTASYALINLDASNCESAEDIIQSKSFEQVLTQFMMQLNAEHNAILDEIGDVKVSEIITLYKLLFIYEFDFVVNSNHNLSCLTGRKAALYDFTEMFYDYWRKIERFGVIKSSKDLVCNNNFASDLIRISDSFNERILHMYRTVSQKLLGKNYIVYRQLPAGLNASLLHLQHKFSDNIEYRNLQNVGFVTGILTRPPFIIYSKSNTRSGLFKKLDKNPISELDINRLHYFVFPVMVGKLLAFTYIHRDFLHHGIGLSNLFEFANYEQFKNRKPDLIYVYGIKENQFDCTYYHDEDEQVYIGFVSRLDKNDYFGYLKKMLLTLHNVHMIDHGSLPIHGAMVSIELKNNQRKNIVIIGDSGAGKSETLEALRIIGSEYIKQMKVIYDDMGLFTNDGGSVYSTGTETGAFVRLDDLDLGYAYQEMDRAIFLNPHKKNARVIIPISSYKYITFNHSIDLVLYANNYDVNEKGITFFNNIDQALSVFKKGLRFAKGTTSEVGLVGSYFANPFGPVQEQAKTDILLDQYFNMLKDQHVMIGELYTKLSIEGQETSGPKEAAKLLLQFLTE